MTRDRSKNIYTFESRLFKGQLIGLMPFWIYLFIAEPHQGVFREQPFVSAGMLLLSVVLLYLTRQDRFLKPVIGLYTVLAVFVFAYYWFLFDGYHGPIAYAYFAFSAVFVILLPNKYRVWFAVSFSGLVALMTLYQTYIDGNATSLTIINKWTIISSYIFCSGVLAVVLIFLKRNFDSGRALILKNNKRLSSLSKRVEFRQKELMNQREEIRSIKENLELLIKERTFELEAKTKKLEKYAYDNAHHVRKPISNILGLLSVIENEKERLSIDPVKLERVKLHAEDLDRITQKINAILR